MFLFSFSPKSVLLVIFFFVGSGSGYVSDMYCYSCDSVETCSQKNLTAVKCDYPSCQKSLNYLNTYFNGVPMAVKSWYYDCIRFEMVLTSNETLSYAGCVYSNLYAVCHAQLRDGYTVKGNLKQCEECNKPGCNSAVRLPNILAPLTISLFFMKILNKFF
ncbi:hypothetical protein ACFFRR_004310 [Megaselia abdita]